MTHIDSVAGHTDHPWPRGPTRHVGPAEMDSAVATPALSDVVLCAPFLYGQKAKSTAAGLYGNRFQCDMFMTVYARGTTIRISN